MMLSQKYPKTLFYLYWGFLSHFIKKYPKVPKIPVLGGNGTPKCGYFWVLFGSFRYFWGDGTSKIGYFWVLLLLYFNWIWISTVYIELWFILSAFIFHEFYSTAVIYAPFCEILHPVILFLYILYDISDFFF